MSERVKVEAKKPEVKRENVNVRMQGSEYSRSMDTGIERILYLQRTVGNQAVQRLVRSGVLQAKLRIGQPRDVYEQEADRVAEQVMQMPEPGVQRQVEPEDEEEETLQSKPLANQITPFVRVQRQEEPEEEEETLQAKPLAGQITPLVQKQVEPEEEEEELQAKATSDRFSEVNSNLESHIQSLKGGGILFLQRTIGNHAVERLIKSGILQAKAIPGSTLIPSNKVNDDGKDSVPKGNGQPLNSELKLVLEHGFGTNLKSVRIHNDGQSHEFAKSRKAYAVTVGQNIYFGRVKNSTDHKSNFQLVAHEVAHTIQQRSIDSQRQIGNIEHYQSLERQADQAAERIVNGQSVNVNPANIGHEEQAKNELTEVPANVLAVKNLAISMGMITENMRRILQTHPHTYDYVMSRLIKRDADWITDKLLELWVSDNEERAIISDIQKWATTPKIEGGNFIDDLLDAIKKFRYRFSYVVSESAWGNMLDKLFAEMENDRYTKLISLIDNFSTRYKGYRGRGGISRWSGMQTAVMPSKVRARLGRLNQRLAGKITIPMTEDEVRRINALYAELRRKTGGMIDMPDIQIGPAVGQQAAPAAAVAIPVIGVVALIKALILAVLVTITLALIIEIIEELERILDRTMEAPSETVTQPVPRAIPRAVPRAIPRAIPRVIPRVVPPSTLPIFWPHFGGKGLPLTAPNPVFNIFLGKILIRSICPSRNWALIRAFKVAHTVLTGQAVHHVTPLFLGGPDSLGNLAAVWISYHIKGHTALRIQPHLAALGMPIDLYAHPRGISYIVSGII